MSELDPHAAIERLLYQYCHGIDTGDFEATAALFGESGLFGLVGSRAARGASQVLGMLRASVRLYDGVPRTRHVVTNAVIDVDAAGVTGSARSTIQVLHQAPGGALNVVVAGSYFDRVHLVDGGWRFAERRMHIELIGDVSTHLQPGYL